MQTRRSEEVPRHVLGGHGRHATLREQMELLAASAGADEERDSYGSGALVQGFEAEVAGLLGTEAGLFLPTGIMAQQIALRIWTERRGRPTIAMHPTAHLEWAEHLAHSFLHGLTRLQFAAPEFVRNRLITRDDLAGIGVDPGVVLLELPHRPLGGQLPRWDQLLAIRDWTRERGIPLHLDGARLWSCERFYGRPLAEIAALFDSVYVSLYKDLGGIAGAMLLGSRDFVAEARVWQVRHGGRLASVAPLVLAARDGFRTRLPQLPAWVDRAREIAAVVTEYPRVTVDPDPPHVNFFRVFIQGEADALNEARVAISAETGLEVFYGLRESEVPGVATTEVHCWENAMTFPLDELRDYLARLFDTA